MARSTSIMGGLHALWALGLIGGGLAQAGGVPDLGVNASLNGRPLLPPGSAWNRRIDTEPVDPNSVNLIASIGATKSLKADFGAEWEGRPFGIPYIVVPGSQPKVKIPFEYAEESDPGPYPLPNDPPIEGGPNAPLDSDRHVLMLDRDRWVLCELFHVVRKGNSYTAGSGAIFDLKTDKPRPAGWTSADAAGLPILPGLARYDEIVQRGDLTHALRFTCRRTRRAYVPPARHFASRSDDPNLPPMGMRVRLKNSYDISRFPKPAQVILQGLKRYGMILADNGSDWFISGAPSPRWNDDELSTLRRVRGQDLEVVRMGRLTIAGSR